MSIDDNKPAEDQPPALEAGSKIAFQQGVVLAGHFEIVRKVGSGGMGVVYEAINRLSGERIALKCIKPTHSLSRRSNVRFIEEINTARKLRHPNIVAVYDVAQQGEQTFFTMEFLDGHSLRKRLVKRGPLSLEEAVQIMRPLCAALEYAHRYMVHRDLSPDNVFLLRNGGVKLLDFGLARDIGRETMTVSGTQLGKAQYMSPEQRKDAAHVDARTDVYALGVMFFELLSGKLPLGYARLSDHVPNLPPACDELVGRALAPLERRIPSAAAFRAALDACVPAATAFPRSENKRISPAVPGPPSPEAMARPSVPLRKRAWRTVYRYRALMVLGLVIVSAFIWAAVHFWPVPAKQGMLSSRTSILPWDEVRGEWDGREDGTKTKWLFQFGMGSAERPFKLSSGPFALEGFYILDEGSTPRKIDFHVQTMQLKDSPPPTWKFNFVLQGSYEFDGSDLRLALNDTAFGFVQQLGQLTFPKNSTFGSSQDIGGVERTKLQSRADFLVTSIHAAERPADIQAEGAAVIQLARTEDLGRSQFGFKPDDFRVALNRLKYPEPDRALAVSWEESDQEALLHLPGDVTLPMIWIPAGTYIGGSNLIVEDDYFPLHTVTLTKGFWLGKYEVTQAQWKAVMTYNPCDLVGDTLPVEGISWNDATLFAKRLSQFSNKHFRLPTEAEWVYACKADVKEPGQFLPEGMSVEDYLGKASGRPKWPQPVGTGLPNGWGLHNMAGNVWEWVSDYYLPGYIPQASEVDPVGASHGGERMAMGGYSYPYPPKDSREFVRRNWYPAKARETGYGMRLCAD